MFYFGFLWFSNGNVCFLLVFQCFLKIAGCSASVAGIQIPQWGPDIARNVSMEAQVAKQGVRRMFMRMQGRK
jgi:hypothetical protein